MPSKKGRPEPRWLVIVEEIRSQNRSTREAVEASRVALDERIDRFEQKTEARFTVVEAAIQSNSMSIAGLEGKFGTLEGRFGTLEQRFGTLEGRFGTLEQSFGALEQRFEQSDRENRVRFDALEAALQRIDQDSRSRDASLELAIRELKVSVQQNSVDIRDLAGKVDALSRLEERVTALERREV